MCVCVGYVHVNAGAHRDQRSDSSRAGVIGGYELPSLGAGNQTLVLCKNSMFC